MHNMQRWAFAVCAYVTVKVPVVENGLLLKGYPETHTSNLSSASFIFLLFKSSLSKCSSEQASQHVPELSQSTLNNVLSILSLSIQMPLYNVIVLKCLSILQCYFLIKLYPCSKLLLGVASFLLPVYPALSPLDWVTDLILEHIL